VCDALIGPSVLLAMWLSSPYTASLAQPIENPQREYGKKVNAAAP